MSKYHWKSDIDFDVQNAALIRSWSAYACRQATMGPLGLFRKGISFPEAYARMQQQFRNRIVDLQDAGLETRIRDPLRQEQDKNAWAIYTRNCPPFGIRLSSVTEWHNPCHRFRYCPNCWAREVVRESFNAVRWALDTVGPKYLHDARLIAIRQPVVPFPLDHVDAAEAWRKGAMEAVRCGFKLFRPVTLLGGRGRLVVDVTGKGEISVTRCTLVLVDYRAVIPELGEGGQSKFARLGTDDDNRNLAKLLAWCLRFPAGMLNGDVKTAVSVLDQLAAVKMAGSAGMLDTDSYRERMLEFRAMVRGRMDEAEAVGAAAEEAGEPVTSADFASRPEKEA